MDRKLSVLESNFSGNKSEADIIINLINILMATNTAKISHFKNLPIGNVPGKLEEYKEISDFQAACRKQLVTLSISLESFLNEQAITDYTTELCQTELTSTPEPLLYREGSQKNDSVHSAAANISALDRTNQIDDTISIRFEPVRSPSNVENITTTEVQKIDEIKVKRVSSPQSEAVQEICEFQVTPASSPPSEASVKTTETQKIAEIKVNPVSSPPSSSSTEGVINDDESASFTENAETFANDATIVHQTDDTIVTINNPQIPTVKVTETLDVEAILKTKKLLSLEDRNMQKLLENNITPDLRLHRSSSSTSVQSGGSSRVSKKTDSTFGLLSTDSNATNNGKNGENVHKDWSEAFIAIEQNGISTSPKIWTSNVEQTIRNQTNIAVATTHDKEIIREFLDAPIPKEQDLCIISYMKTPQNFYIQLYDHSDTIMALVDHLKAAHETSEKFYTSKEDAKREIGKYCAAYIEDYKTWHRAEVLDWQMLSPANTVLVVLVDYGETLKIPVEHICELMSEFFEQPKYAVNCSFECLYPPSSKENAINTIWTTTELDNFFEWFKNECQVTYKLTYVNGSSKPIGIDMIDLLEEDMIKSVGQQLIDAKIAAQFFPEAKVIGTVKKVPDNLVMLEQIKSVQGLADTHENMTDAERMEKFLENNDCAEPKNLVEAVTGYDANDERRICKFTKPDGTCFKGLNCKLEHTQLRPDGFTTDRHFVFHAAMSNITLPSVDEEITVYVTCITGINEFYGHILNKSDLKRYGSSIQKLGNDLRNESAVKNFEHLSLLPSIGQILLAKNWDGSWCRARVLHLNVPMVDVFIVDYGETVTVNIEDLREIICDYLILPFQANKFRLCDIEKGFNVDEREAISYMEQQYLCEEFVCKVRSSSPILYVDVFLTTGIDMCSDLVTKGFAKRTFGKQLIIEKTLVD